MKVCLIGSAATVLDAPWQDRSWTIWAHSSAQGIPRCDRWFDLHPKRIWHRRKPWCPTYPAWLRALRTPIYMQTHDPTIPASVAYPKARILAEFGPYFTSQTAWMIALALTEGVTHLSLYGIHYDLAGERRWQRAGCEWMLGIAFGRGVTLCLPPGSPLLADPPYLYGYESHTPARIRERQSHELHASQPHRRPRQHQRGQRHGKRAHHSR